MDDLHKELLHALIDASEELQALIIKRELGAMDVGAAIQTANRCNELIRKVTTNPAN
jgi:hypothetical protein